MAVESDPGQQTSGYVQEGSQLEIAMVLAQERFPDHCRLCRHGKSVTTAMSRVPMSMHAFGRDPGGTPTLHEGHGQARYVSDDACIRASL